MKGPSFKTKVKVIDKLIEALYVCDGIPVRFKNYHLSVLRYIKEDLISLYRNQQEDKKDD